MAAPLKEVTVVAKTRLYRKPSLFAMDVLERSASFKSGCLALGGTDQLWPETSVESFGSALKQESEPSPHDNLDESLPEASQTHAPSSKPPRFLPVIHAAYQVATMLDSETRSPYSQPHIQEIVTEATDLALVYRFAEEPCYPRLEALSLNSPEKRTECPCGERDGCFACLSCSSPDATGPCKPSSDWPEADEFLASPCPDVGEMLRRATVRRFHSY